jgi:two-component sensor histidine kinase
VDVRQFLEELLASQIVAEQGRAVSLRTELDADDLEVDPDKLAPLALFAVEAITLARRHVFAEGEGRLRVRFTVRDEVRLEIADNGREPSDEDAGAGVGGTLMTAYARQLRGRMERQADEAGVSVALVFPAPEGARAAALAAAVAPAPQSGPERKTAEPAARNQAVA